LGGTHVGECSYRAALGVLRAALDSAHVFRPDESPAVTGSTDQTVTSPQTPQPVLCFCRFQSRQLLGQLESDPEYLTPNI
jgi:hypothetical protein